MPRIRGNVSEDERQVTAPAEEGKTMQIVSKLKTSGKLFSLAVIAMIVMATLLGSPGSASAHGDEDTVTASTSGAFVGGKVHWLSTRQVTISSLYERDTASALPCADGHVRVFYTNGVVSQWVPVASGSACGYGATRYNANTPFTWTAPSGYYFSKLQFAACAATCGYWSVAPGGA